MVAATMITKLDSTDSASLKQIAKATQITSKISERNEKQMVSSASTMEKLIRTGAVTLANTALSEIAKTGFGSAGGSAAGAAASSIVSSAITGAVSGGMLGGIPGAVIGGAAGGLLGLVSGATQTFQAKDDTFKAWYKGLYETAGAGTESMLASGKALASGELGQKQAAWETMQAELNLAGGTGYFEERTKGLTDQLMVFGGELGTALQEANEAIGAGRAAQENLADQYTREALAAVLTGEATTLDWSKENQTELKELAGKYETAMAEYEAGNAEAGILIETYVEEARALAQAQYDSSAMVQEATKAEQELVTAIRANTSALDGWKDDYAQSQNLSKGLVSVKMETVTPEQARKNEEHMQTLRNLGLYATGIRYVPYDNFPALLHQGERVLTAAEARSAGNGPSVVISGNSFTIREEADVDRVAAALYQKLQLASVRG